MWDTLYLFSFALFFFISGLTKLAPSIYSGWDWNKEK